MALLPIVTILASAALKAAFSVALDEVRKFLIDMVNRRSQKKLGRAHTSAKAVVILDIKGLTLKHARPQLDLENLEEAAIEDFIKGVQQSVLDTAKSATKS